MNLSLTALTVSAIVTDKIDAGLTFYGLSNGAKEAAFGPNLLSSFVSMQEGIVALMVFKTLTVLAAFMFAAKFNLKTESALAYAAVILLIAGYSVASGFCIVNNITVLGEMRLI